MRRKLNQLQSVYGKSPENIALHFNRSRMRSSQNASRFIFRRDEELSYKSPKRSYMV